MYELGCISFLASVPSGSANAQFAQQQLSRLASIHKKLKNKEALNSMEEAFLRNCYGPQFEEYKRELMRAFSFARLNA